MLLLQKKTSVNLLNRRIFISTTSPTAGLVKDLWCVNLLSRRTFISTLEVSGCETKVEAVSIPLIGESSFLPYPSESGSIK